MINDKNKNGTGEALKLGQNKIRTKAAYFVFIPNFSTSPVPFSESLSLMNFVSLVTLSLCTCLKSNGPKSVADKKILPGVSNSSAFTNF